MICWQDCAPAGETMGMVVLARRASKRPMLNLDDLRPNWSDSRLVIVCVWDWRFASPSCRGGPGSRGSSAELASCRSLCLSLKLGLKRKPTLCFCSEQATFS